MGSSFDVRVCVVCVSVCTRVYVSVCVSSLSVLLSAVGGAKVTFAKLGFRDNATLSNTIIS